MAAIRRAAIRTEGLGDPDLGDPDRHPAEAIRNQAEGLGDPDLGDPDRHPAEAIRNQAISIRRSGQHRRSGRRVSDRGFAWAGTCVFGSDSSPNIRS